VSNPQLLYDLACMRQREMRRNAARERLASAARRPGSRFEAHVLLPLANSFIALGMRLRRRYQPDESIAIVPVAQLAGSAGWRTGGAGGRVGTLLPVFAFQVIQCQPQRTTNLTYWSLLPPTSSVAASTSRLGLLCLARPLSHETRMTAH
jgi:hypothetical protein